MVVQRIAVLNIDTVVREVHILEVLVYHAEASIKVVFVQTEQVGMVRDVVVPVPISIHAAVRI